MKRISYVLFCLLVGVLYTACSEKQDAGYNLTQVVIALHYPDGSVNVKEGVTVKMRNTVNGSELQANTDANGEATFSLPQGVYDASATDVRTEGGESYIFNGTSSRIVVEAQPVNLMMDMTSSSAGKVVIKELYAGGCPDDKGGKGFAMDQSVVLYNNSAVTVELSDLALAIVNPYNATSNNADYENGVLKYQDKGWIPAGMAIWHFNGDVSLAPGKQLVVNITGAVDNTKTYSQSVNYAHPEYYCCYDPQSGLNNKLFYPAPSEQIPSSHYLSAMVFGMGNAWPLSQLSPAIFLFRPKDTTLQAFVADASTTDNYGGNTSMGRKKVPNSWIVDGVEVFQNGVKGALKRFTKDVDAGYVSFTSKLGYTLYRNVNKEATEAIPGNQGKLVYNYAGGIQGSTDSSGIDAEASLKNGARIIYLDTNNSTNDFHVRAKSSLRE